jgi:PKD repeat protein
MPKIKAILPFSGIAMALVLILSGCSDPPEACFSVDATLVDQNAEVVFRNCSQFQQEGYQWDFGDGGTSNTVSPIYRFINQGEFLVVLTSKATTSVNDDSYSEVIKVGSRFVTTAQVTDFPAAPSGGGSWDDADGPDIALLFLNGTNIEFMTAVEDNAMSGSSYALTFPSTNFELTPDNWTIILADMDGVSDYDTIAILSTDFGLYEPVDQQQVTYNSTTAAFTVDYRLQ